METATNTNEVEMQAARRKVCKRCGSPVRGELDYCYLCRTRRVVSAEKKRQLAALTEMQTVRTSAKRRCHDCGKPTNNYRCEACWVRLRKKHGVPVDGDVNVSGGWE